MRRIYNTFSKIINFISVGDCEVQERLDAYCSAMDVHGSEEFQCDAAVDGNEKIVTEKRYFLKFNFRTF